jgi:hypothetical protein
MRNFMIRKSAQLLFVICLVMAVFGGFIAAHGADTIVTKTFEWEQAEADLPRLVEWEMFWGVVAGGPYASLLKIPYDSSLPVQPTYEAPTTVTVTGPPGTTQTRYFVLKACGNIPQSDGTTKYECSDNSNEVSWDFWIAATGFSAPVKFSIKPE